ncbi:MAG: hypothetical protein LBD74_03910 [Spirochaetaceae bacterium]|jgi:hypothetical protein|nr:hypothetical protein [Spirochaetaceae bacterium]
MAFDRECLGGFFQGAENTDELMGKILSEHDADLTGAAGIGYKMLLKTRRVGVDRCFKRQITKPAICLLVMPDMRIRSGTRVIMSIPKKIHGVIGQYLKKVKQKLARINILRRLLRKE